MFVPRGKGPYMRELDVWTTLRPKMGGGEGSPPKERAATAPLKGLETPAEEQ
jgi:hypothetical protein